MKLTQQLMYSVHIHHTNLTSIAKLYGDNKRYN